MKRKIKKEIRIVGIDDGHFEKFKSDYCKAIGVIFRGGEFIDGLISFDIKVDGDDATIKIAEAINKSKHKGQLGIIMINGIALAGFNVIDIKLLSSLTSLPVIIVSRKKPRLKLIKETLKKINQEEKIKLIKKAGKPKTFPVGDKKIYYQFCNIDEEKVKEILKLTIKRGLMPEPLRVAHIIATGISLGENKGRV